MDSCNHEKDTVSTISPGNGATTGKLRVASVSANADGLVAIASDSVSQDIFMIYGTLKNDGSLRPLSKITRLKKNGDLIAVRFTENSFTPSETIIRSKNESVLIKLINVYQYDGTIDFDVTNMITAKTGTVKAYKLSEQSFNRLLKAQELYSTNFRSARITSTSCAITLSAGSILEAIECAFTIDPIPAIIPIIGNSFDQTIIPVMSQDCKVALTVPTNNKICSEYPEIVWNKVTVSCNDAVGSGGETAITECYTKVSQLISH